MPAVPVWTMATGAATMTERQDVADFVLRTDRMARGEERAAARFRPLHGFDRMLHGPNEIGLAAAFPSL